MKNVALIGASGFVGSALLKELLERGHQVTAIVRNPEKITVSHPRLTIVRADVSDSDAIVEATTGKDAIISAYNPGWGNPHIYEDTLHNYAQILAAA